MEELVSVIIPSYKRDRTLVERAVQSVLGQTYKKIEVVLVDDNAKSELETYRSELEKMVQEIQDDRLHYVQNKENLGGSGARNVGISEAKGEYITFLDDDDEYLPLKIEKQLKFMKERDLDVSFTKLDIYNENGKLIDVREHNIKSFDLVYLRKYHLTKQITGTPTFMMKKYVLEDVNGFDIVSMGQEFYLMQKILMREYKIGYCPFCYIKAYRTKAEAISTGKGKITGEKGVYKYKKQFFKLLNLKEKRYVRCRHYAVMAVAYKRNKKYIKALGSLIMSVLCDPMLVIKEAFGLNKRIKKGETIMKSLYEKIKDGEEKLSLVGLGYVGMPIAVAFAQEGVKVVGFDLNEAKIGLYKSGIDPTHEVGDEIIKNTTVEFTSDEKKLQEAKFHIVAVPTPVNQDHTPDLSPVIGASEILGRNLTKGSIVVFESTVYPGVTEDVCVPVLEKFSGLKCGVDFKVGYSPERINPGDKVHRLENIKKIVSGMDEESLREIQNVYDLVIKVGTFPVSTIKTAEAVKVVENSQRDINIAFMNELAMVFDRMGIDTAEVVAGMNTKWNALGFRPGLVGGHCIGVDPYYFTYEAEKLGYHSQIILNGRIVNDSMGAFVAESTIKQMILAGKNIRDSKVVILGLTFKENCPDTRNSKVEDIIKTLNEYGVKPLVVDPWASERDAQREYGVSLVPLSEIREADCIILTVAHDEFKNLTLEQIDAMYKNIPNQEKVLIDVKSILDKKAVEKIGYTYWRL